MAILRGSGLVAKTCVAITEAVVKAILTLITGTVLTFVIDEGEFLFGENLSLF